MEQELRHYRIGGKLTHHGVEILPNGKDIEIYISRIQYHDRLNVGGREEQGVWTASFLPNPHTTLDIILNSTNRKRLAKLAKTPYLETVKDFPIRLTQEKTRDVRDGGETMGLRVSLIPAKNPIRTDAIQQPKQTLPIEGEAFDKVKAYLDSRGQIAEVEKKWIITDEVKQKLLAEDGSEGA